MVKQWVQIGPYNAINGSLVVSPLNADGLPEALGAFVAHDARHFAELGPDDMVTNKEEFAHAVAVRLAESQPDYKPEPPAIDPAAYAAAVSAFNDLEAKHGHCVEIVERLQKENSQLLEQRDHVQSAWQSMSEEFDTLQKEYGILVLEREELHHSALEFEQLQEKYHRLEKAYKSGEVMVNELHERCHNLSAECEKLRTIATRSVMAADPANPITIVPDDRYESFRKKVILSFVELLAGA